MSQPVLSIAVPCYNEEENIPGVVRRFNEALAGHADIELLLIDNGSTDQTGTRIDEEIQRQGCTFARKIHVPVNKGYGYGIMAGLKEAHGRVLAWTHADLQTDPEDVLKAYELYQNKAAGTRPVFVKGHRRNRRFSEKFFSFGMQLVSSAVLGVWLEEVNAQPKLFPRSFYEEMKDPPHDFSLDLYVLYLAKKKGYNIGVLPVYFKKRLHGEAKGGGGSNFKTRWKLIRRTWTYIFELKAKLKD